MDTQRCSSWMDTCGLSLPLPAPVEEEGGTRVLGMAGRSCVRGSNAPSFRKPGTTFSSTPPPLPLLPLLPPIACPESAASLALALPSPGLEVLHDDTGAGAGADAESAVPVPVLLTVTLVEYALCAHPCICSCIIMSIGCMSFCVAARVRQSRPTYIDLAARQPCLDLIPDFRDIRSIMTSSRGLSLSSSAGTMRKYLLKHEPTQACHHHHLESRNIFQPPQIFKL